MNKNSTQLYVTDHKMKVFQKSKLEYVNDSTFIFPFKLRTLFLYFFPLLFVQRTDDVILSNGGSVFLSNIVDYCFHFSVSLILRQICDKRNPNERNISCNLFNILFVYLFRKRHFVLAD